MASLPSSTTTLTHLLTFLAGIIVGKAIDQDELNAYRVSNEDGIAGFVAKIRRQIKTCVFGGVILGLVYSVGRRALTGGNSEKVRKL
ncbi:hypothetical protein ACHAWX_004323 [Stephanocyclus meneghinianus]